MLKVPNDSVNMQNLQNLHIAACKKLHLRETPGHWVFNFEGVGTVVRQKKNQWEQLKYVEPTTNEAIEVWGDPEPGVACLQPVEN